MKLLWITVHPWGPSVRSRADFVDTYWTTTTFFAHVTYWSPVFSVVVNLIENLSVLLFHILSTAIVSLGMPDLSLFSSTSVMGHFISWSMVTSTVPDTLMCLYYDTHDTSPVLSRVNRVVFGQILHHCSIFFHPLVLSYKWWRRFNSRLKKISVVHSIIYVTLPKMCTTHLTYHTG